MITMPLCRRLLLHSTNRFVPAQLAILTNTFDSACLQLNPELGFWYQLTQVVWKYGDYNNIACALLH